MRFRFGVVFTLLITVAIVACSRGNESTPAPTILSPSTDTPAPIDETRGPEPAANYPTATMTPMIQATLTETATATPTSTPFPTALPTPTMDLAPVASPTPAGKPVAESPTPLPTAHPTPTTPPTPTATPEPTQTATVEPSPTATAEPTATVEPTPAPTATAEPSPTSTAAPEPPPEISWVDNPDCASVGTELLKTVPVKLSWQDFEETVTAEVAATSAQRSQGLMCREDLPDGSGMLFLFDQPRSGGFWMFNTYVPLDILYIDSSGNVIWHDTMQPCAREQSESDNAWRSRCRSMISRPDDSLGGYTTALELPAGWLAQIGIGLDLAGEMTVTWQ